MNPDELIALADRLRALEQIAYAADTFLDHIKGYRLWISPSDEPRDVFHKDIPEAIALASALDSWHAVRGDHR